MIIYISYLLMGIIVGILLKYEIDIRTKKKRIEKRFNYLKATAENSQMKQYDDILVSIRGINESLQQSQKQQKKEVQ